jgi:hypothetical protein
VESHFSQRTREMGHPSARCYLLLADGSVRSTRAGADAARVNLGPFPILRVKPRFCAAVILGWNKDPKRFREVESHFSQRTREMGHPSERCYLLLADGCVRSARARADAARVELISFPKVSALCGGVFPEMGIW